MAVDLFENDILAEDIIVFANLQLNHWANTQWNQH